MNNYEKFKEKAEAVQGIVTKINSLDQAFLYVEDVFKKNDFKNKTLAAPFFDEKALSDASESLKNNKISVVTKDLRNQKEGVDVGLTFADFGIAETGTLVIDSSKEDLRLATMLSQIHVAVLPESQMKEKTEDIENELNAVLSKDAAYLAFITGASRTADIERVLALGVHGPFELHILVYEGV
jgi:L-lactate dehydrogenase complex protein LldG